MSQQLLAVGIAYLLGSLSFSYYVVRLVRKEDVRVLGSGNAGATNVLRTSGKWAALAAVLLDISKGIVAVLVARLIGVEGAWTGVAAVAAVLGHIFPVFLGFRGGKGVATGAGALWVLAPLPGAVALLLFLAVAAFTRFAALASVLAAVSYLPLLVLSARLGLSPAPEPWLLWTCLAIGLLIVLMHRSNLRRLLAGTEARVTDKVPSQDEVSKEGDS